MQKVLTADEIRKTYFSNTVANSTLTTPNYDVRRSATNEMTPSARYILNESRKLMAQRGALAEDASCAQHTPTEEELLSLINHVEESEHEPLSAPERTQVLAALNASLHHYGILTPLIENPEINDIIIRAYNDISVQKNRRNIQTDLKFPDQASYKAFIENLLKRCGKACTTATPVVDAAVDPHVRACATHESFSPHGSGPMLTLRVARHHNVTVESLAQNELAPQIILDYLSAIIEHGLGTILVAGEVGSGKTTLIKALANRIPDDEAVLAIEDTHELVLHRPFMRTLLTREANTEGMGRISPALAIRTGMRMAMNRLLLGEMRDAEAAEAFIDVCSSGHCGMSTIHARSAQDAISRLELFLARAQRTADNDTIRRQIANAVSVVVFLDVDRKFSRRRIFEIIEIHSFGDKTIQYSPMFSYVPTASNPQWKRNAGISAFSVTLREAKVELPTNASLLTLNPETMLQNFSR